jgi:hypothetical protein
MLLPALAQAREAAKRTTCINQEKQLYLWSLAYIDDYDAYVPPSLYPTALEALTYAHKDFGYHNWRYIPMQPTDYDGNPWKSILVCPSLVGQYEHLYVHGPYPYWYSTYTYNRSCGRKSVSWDVDEPQIKFQRVIRPSERGWWMDGVLRDYAKPPGQVLWYGVFGISPTNELAPHHDRTNFLCFDGHVETQKRGYYADAGPGGRSFWRDTTK